METAAAAYGAGKAGGAFDPLTFARQPQTLLRAVSWLFSIVVFGSIVNEGYVNRPNEIEEHCVFNRNANACNYGITIGVLAFLGCLAFLGLDAYFPQISSVKDRKKVVLGDIGFSACWSFLWFVGFCFLTNQWQVTNLVEDNPLKEGADAARAAITFSFFSIFTWMLLDLLSISSIFCLMQGIHQFRWISQPTHIQPASGIINHSKVHTFYLSN
ncbi:synaptogyrin-1-like isoform X2 [Narcine bancroftii]|uniref:synaptogyrin-1-like isoform X2 n=1 Tax=Narcine bancroftii TaxID=1343680 RepID=UPI003831C664